MKNQVVAGKFNSMSISTSYCIAQSFGELEVAEKKFGGLMDLHIIIKALK